MNMMVKDTSTIETMFASIQMNLLQRVFRFEILRSDTRIVCLEAKVLGQKNALTIQVAFDTRT